MTYNVFGGTLSLTQSINHIRWHIQPETDSVMAAPVLCILVMCMKLHNLHINCSALMSVIRSHDIDMLGGLKLYC